MDVRLPDGTIVRGVPEGTTKAELAEKLSAKGMTVPSEWMDAKPKASETPGKIETLGAGLGKGFGTVVLGAQDLLGRGINAAGNVVTPRGVSDLVTGQQPALQRLGNWLRQDAQQGRAKLAAELKPYSDANPITAKAGEITGEAVPTYVAGLGLGKLVGGVAPRLGSAIGSGGMSTGGAPVTGLEKLADLGIRTAGGGINGYLTGQLIDPETANTSAAIGAVLPSAVKTAAAGGEALSRLVSDRAKALMQSAIKPTLKQLKTGEADIAAQTLLDYGLSPNRAGVEKLRSLIDDLNTNISGKIASSGATVPKQDVLSALSSVRAKFANQVAPTSDLQAIQRVADDFAAHPAIVPDIPVQVAQQMKQGTYRVLADKFGQLGSAEVEAQKGLARGLKEGVAKAVPEVAQLNADEARLLKTLSVTERRALMELNKNPVGLSALAGSPAGFAAFMADRSSAFKALAAKMLNRSAQVPGGQALEALAANPIARNAALISAESNP